VAENRSIHREQLHVEATQPPPGLLEAAHHNQPTLVGPNAPQPMNMNFPHPILPWVAAPFRPRTGPPFS
jgi:hypothetical protein